VIDVRSNVNKEWRAINNERQHVWLEVGMSGVENDGRRTDRGKITSDKGSGRYQEMGAEIKQ